jgi:glycine cleavage system H protein
MDFPVDLSYAKTHEWVRQKGDEAIVGITSYAQEQLRDIVFVELPKLGRKVKAKQPCAVIESVKAAYDTYAPVSGEIIRINTELEGSPQLINEDPYGKGWLFAIKMNDPGELKELLSSQAYAVLCKEEHH